MVGEDVGSFVGDLDGCFVGLDVGATVVGSSVGEPVGAVDAGGGGKDDVEGETAKTRSSASSQLPPEQGL